MELQRAREILETLAEGIDPLTGEVLPADDLCNRGEIVRALYCVLNAAQDRPKRPRPENAGRPWTAQEEEALCRMFDAGAARREICTGLKRTEGAIAARLVRLGKIRDREEFRRR